MNTLIDQFELNRTGRFRAVMNVDDVLAMLHHYWVFSDEYYPEERQRLQHTIMNIFCASITARAETVIESNGYLEQNDAVKYRDIRMYAVQDERNPDGINLRMPIQLRLLKSRRNRGNPPKIKLKERQDVSSFCLIKAICGLAFKNRAFASECICESKDLYKIKIPARLNSVPIKWAAEWQKVPVLRRSAHDSTGKIHTSPALAAQYNQMTTWNRRLDRSFGMKDNFEFKMHRRSAGEALPEAVRSQAMGHVNGTIYERSYHNQVVDANTVSAFTDTPSDEMMMKLTGHVSLTADPITPAGPTSA